MSYGRPVRIAVVIPARDEAETIAGTIEKARTALDDDDGARGGPPIEVIVVDGGSLDHTPDRARAAGATVLHCEAGRARQLEMGWRGTEAEIVLFLHADTGLAPGSGAAIERALADRHAVGGAFRFGFDERRWTLWWIERGARLRHRWLGLPYGDQAIFVRREVLHRIGGLPQVPIMEDLDLVERLKREGTLVALALPARTSARRYLQRGVFRTWFRNAVALAAWRMGVSRDRVAAWYRR